MAVIGPEKKKGNKEAGREEKLDRMKLDNSSCHLEPQKFKKK